MGLFRDINDPLVRDVVNTADLDRRAYGTFAAVAEPVQSLHGDHCFAEVEVVEWSHRHGRQVTGTTLVLVCGWPAEHNS